MQKSDNTICIRCGKQRIFSKTWDEHVGTSLVTVTLNVCPDPECQKAVENELKKKKDHLNDIQAKSLKRKEENRRNKRNIKGKNFIAKTSKKSH